MISKERILELANAHLVGSSLFVTRINLGAGNAISVFIDGDNGVKIDDCVALSRAIESGLDRNQEDFALDVSSHGASSPILFPRQYPKHKGREFEIKLNSGGQAEGTLIDFNDRGITLEYSVRENKPLGKGKITVSKQNFIEYNQIKESKIKLKF